MRVNLGSRESNGLGTALVRVRSPPVRLRAVSLEGSCHQRFSACTNSGALSAVVRRVQGQLGTAPPQEISCDSSANSSESRSRQYQDIAEGWYPIASQYKVCS
ncbi:hypothetical protein [Trichocoleus sp. FACHB-262]|uniref:hypothetical protein n=1 Tax=Trichocoleus sp. FACHB-262 TaxID=2692869 RepID=UPI0016866C4B|nr:hypothetical protein [Trichocoleus sp. FACHB-262]MBD2119347.1 hypothetical protein [Trichocoleus sp. FACHB-262]